MFTVILLTESAQMIFGRAKQYFAPYVEAGQVAFCNWNQSPRARTLAEAVPDLPGIIQGKASWRAIVVDHPGTADEVFRAPDNPFDFLDNTQLPLSLKDSPHTLVRIAHILLGYPQLGAKMFQPIISYTHSETGDRYEQTAVDVLNKYGLTPSVAETAEEREEQDVLQAIDIVGKRHHHVQRNFVSVNYSESEREQHLKLHKQYSMKEVRPFEVIFISTSAITEEDEHATLKSAWETNTDHNSSRFVERNDYPPMSRFAKYELVEPEHSGYEQSELRFWLSILSLATNILPPSTFQAERLYVLNAEFSDERLSKMLNSHISLLAMVRDHVESLLTAPQRMPDLAVNDVIENLPVEVEFEELGGEKLVVSEREYGLAVDSPKNNFHQWSDEINSLNSHTSMFVKKPRRVLSRSVIRARERARMPVNADRGVLGEVQQEELEDDLDQQMRNLIAPATADVLNRRRLQKIVDDGDSEIRHNMSQRMRKSTILLTMLGTFGVWLFTFAPYLVRAVRREQEILGNGILMFSSVLALMFVTGFLVLWIMKLLLVRRIRNFNERLREYVTSVSRGAEAFGNYLSDFVTYMRGRSLLRSANELAEGERERLQRLRRLQDKLLTKISQEKTIVQSLGQPVEVQLTYEGLSAFDPEDPHDVESLFRFPVGENSIPFNVSGDTISAPYDFVTRLTLERVALFEPAHLRTGRTGLEGQ